MADRGIPPATRTHRIRSIWRRGFPGHEGTHHKYRRVASKVHVEDRARQISIPNGVQGPLNIADRTDDLAAVALNHKLHLHRDQPVVLNNQYLRRLIQNAQLVLS